jgi:DHA1 family multidrug resistance protein-like MFS transporter
MQKNRSLAIIFFALVVIMLGFGIVIPILPFYVDHFGGTGTDLGLLMAIYSVMQFIFSPMWGRLSDHYGRKPILMIGIIGFALTLFLYGLIGQAATAGWFAPSTALVLLIIARGLGGILSSATLPTSMAMISDSTTEQNRGGGMGLIGAAMGIGMVLGPGIGGLLSEVSLSAPFYFGAVVSLLAAALTWLMVTESLKVEMRTKSAEQLQGPNLTEMWRALSGPIGFLLILAFLQNFALANFEGVFGLYAQKRYAYNATQVGVILTVVGLVSAIVQGALTGPATRKWGDEAVIKFSLFTSAFGFVAMSLAESEPAKISSAVVLAIGFFMFSNAMLRPGVASLISKRAESGQGTAMGMNNAFMSLGRIFGPLWAGYSLDVNLSYPYSTGAAMMLIGFVACLFFLKPLPAVQSTPAQGDD